jgi:hypothetical protein
MHAYATAAIEPYRAALRELVALKDLKDEELRQRQRRPVHEPKKLAQCDAMQKEYRRRKPLAWAAARALIVCV